jgi:ribose transport system ATP-binding protein
VAILAVRHVSKRFAGVRALDHASLTVLPGEIHGLLGENGSGKSTLIRILAGVHAPESGAELVVRDRPVPLPLRPDRARELGLVFVHQSLGLIPSLSVVENLRLGELAARRDLRISWRRERRRAREALARFEVDLDPRQQVAHLQPVERALLAIVRAGEEMRSSRSEQALLVLDEPTVFLPEPERRRLLTLVRALADEGSSILFVSHDLDEVIELADRVTVLRDGRTVAVLENEQLDRSALVELMTGRRSDTAARQIPARLSPAASVARLGGEIVRDVSFDVRAGEVLGLTGARGSGFDEIPYLLFGARPSRSGRLTLGDDVFETASMTPGRALRAGIALIPADRERDGGVGSLPVADNVTLPVVDRYRRRLVLDRRRLRTDASDLIARFRIHPDDPELPFRALSGGNQQKALLAKALNSEPRLLLLDGPTRGVDVGARAHLFERLRAVAATGTSIICATTDREELTALCDRVLVIAGGRCVQPATAS